MTTLRSLPALALALLVSSGSLDAQVVAYVGATVWDATGSAPIRDATMIVENGRITAIASAGDLPSGAQIVRLDGKFIIPGLIDTHGHVSGEWAPQGVTGESDRIREELELFAKYGVTTVNSLGDGDAVVAVRDAASPTDPRARLLAAGSVIAGSDPAAARAAAITNAEAGVDWLKLRVDDNLGTVRKMPWDAVQAVLDVGEERGVRVATHLFYLDDAKRLLEMGTGMVAHSVRDTDVDDSFINALIANEVCYVPTLTREMSTFVYAERPGFFDNDFFTELANEREVARVSEPAFMERMRRSPEAAGYRIALRQALRNLKLLVDAGAPVTFGTDAGPAGRFPGFFEHLELSLMVGASLEPEQVLIAATSRAAACLGLDDVGTLEVGKWADFIVLASSPMLNITNTQTLEQVYVAGKPMR